MKRIWAQFWNHWVMPVTYVCLDSATTQNSWRTSAQRTYLVPTFGRSLNFNRARWAGRWSTGMLRISLCGANAMYFWPVWVSPSYCKLQRNPYCDHRIFPFFLMLGVEQLFAGLAQLLTTRQVGWSYKLDMWPAHGLNSTHKHFRNFNFNFNYRKRLSKSS